MIRMRSAFLVILIAILAAFCIGVQAGYFAARSSSLVEGMERWADEVKTTVSGASCVSGEPAAETAEEPRL